MAGPIVAGTLLGKTGAIVIFLLVFCSLASSIDSLLAATTDLVTNDFVHGWLAPDAEERTLRRASTWIVLSIGLFTWCLCLLNLGTLATVLFFAGPLVGSAIWPILLGLYSRRITSGAATLAMSAGSVTGLVAYFLIGWYTASIVGTGVSFVVCLVALRFTPGTFDWKRLSQHDDLEAA